MFAWVKKLQTIPTILVEDWPRTSILTAGKIYTEEREAFASY